jgi:glutathione S-transferase
MALCSGIRNDGGRCKAQAMRNSDYCIGHDPEQAEARRRRASKGGKRGGRGRPSAELARLQRRFEELADKVLSGDVERGIGAVAGQLLNGARACVRDALSAREQEELVERLEALEAALESSQGSGAGGGRWGA